MSGRFSRTIYVGNLPSDTREREVEDLFYKFESCRDAEDAINGCRLRVELAHDLVPQVILNSEVRLTSKIPEMNIVYEKSKVAGEHVNASSSAIAESCEQKQQKESNIKAALPRFAPELDGVHCFETIVLH